MQSLNPKLATYVQTDKISTLTPMRSAGFAKQNHSFKGLRSQRSAALKLLTTPQLAANYDKDINYTVITMCLALLLT